ncbi:MAG: exodeoxyribonuclease VII large subunit [Pseudomonadota bacterium]
MTTQPNLKEYTVSELSGAVKRALEDGFGYVRVRGELGRVVKAGSGHVYLDLKDERAVLSGVMWKGVAARQPVAPEQGMEVIASGKVSTFPGQSKYQIIIDSLEPAGAGALMALLEERKKKLAAEGLFDPARKRELPFLPETIGVVTSPSGAVIRDILHRLRDRFPSHVVVWPTLVQGRGAEAQIADAIDGFNALPVGGRVARPEVLIVARGGGSLEDLWCFNEEVVVRAAARSQIPLISAVGHETDTTLIDFAADQRAPTPTAAAEMATPVRAELLAETMNKARRLETALARLADAARGALRAAARGLGRPEDLLGQPAQRVDRAGDRLVAALAARRAAADARFAQAGARLGPQALRPMAGRLRDRFETVATRLDRTRERDLPQRAERLANAAKLLETLSHKSALRRGFALVLDENGRLVSRAVEASPGDRVRIAFDDGERAADIVEGGAQKGAAARGKRKSTKPHRRAVQESLFD